MQPAVAGTGSRVTGGSVYHFDVKPVCFARVVVPGDKAVIEKHYPFDVGTFARCQAHLPGEEKARSAVGDDNKLITEHFS